MGKTLETKREILSRLKGERKTVTQLSWELGLSKATVSQHLAELRSMGAVEEDDNSHFRRLKYFKIREPPPQPFGGLGRVVAVVLAFAAVGAIYAALALTGGNRPLAGSGPNTLVATQVASPNASASITGTSACPLLRYYKYANATDVSEIVGMVANGSPCYLSYINTTSHTIEVGGGVSYTSSNGTIYVPLLNYMYSLTQSQRDALQSPNERYCWQYTALEVFGINETRSGTCKPSIYT